jgi:hypothetical protein
MTRLRNWLGNPWGKPRVLVLFTALYLVWSIVPILIAIRFLVQRGPVALDRARLVAALVHGRSRQLGVP